MLPDHNSALEFLEISKEIKIPDCDFFFLDSEDQSSNLDFESS